MDEARLARDAALERVRCSHEIWTEVALGRIERMCLENPDERMIGEQVRHKLIAGGLPQPKKPNAWGMLINIAIKRELLQPTGIYMPMNDEHNHARQSQVHRFVAHLRGVSK